MNFFFAKRPARDLSAFLLFYDQYAAKLWGVILSADLPMAQSKNLLAKTLLKAWYHPDRQTIGSSQALTWLVNLAYAEGLPTDMLRGILKNSPDF